MQSYILTLRSTPISYVEYMFAIVYLISFRVIFRRLYRNRKTGMYFIRKFERTLRVGFEDGTHSRSELMRKYSPEDITYIAPWKIGWYIVLFFLPVLFIFLSFYFQLRAV